MRHRNKSAAAFPTHLVSNSLALKERYQMTTGMKYVVFVFVKLPLRAIKVKCKFVTELMPSLESTDNLPETMTFLK